MSRTPAVATASHPDAVAGRTTCPGRDIPFARRAPSPNADGPFFDSVVNRSEDTVLKSLS